MLIDTPPVAHALYLSDPIARNRELRPYSPGQTLAEIAPGWNLPHIAIVGDAPVLRGDWATTVLEGDAPVLFLAIPQDPVTAIIAAFVADAAATYIATELVMAAAVGWTSAAAVTALYAASYMAAYVATSYLVSAAIGTPSAPSNQAMGDAAAASPTYSLTASSNQARVNQPIPVQYGRMKVFPDLLTAPYAEYRTNLDANGDQYLIQDFMVGQGEYDIEGLWIDDTAIANFSEVVYSIQAPGAPSPSSVICYTNPEVGGNTLETNQPIIITAVPEGRTASRIDFDIICPKGLYYSETDGSQSAKTVNWRVEYRIVGSATWNNAQDAAPTYVCGTANEGGTITLMTPPGMTMSARTFASYGTPNGSCNGFTVGGCHTDGTYCYSSDENGCIEYRNKFDEAFLGKSSGSLGINNGTFGDPCQGTYKRAYVQYALSGTVTGYYITAATTTLQRRTYSLTLPAARYEFRFTRLDAKDTSARAGHEVQLAAIKSFLQPPSGFDVAFGSTTRIHLEMRATDQLTSQSARKIAVIGTRKLPLWNGSSWTAPTATRSPAWALADCLRATYGAQLADSRIDLAGLAALATEWAGRGDTFDAVFDGRITVWEALGKIARAGRARPFMQGGRIRFARDRLETLPVAMFTPANMLAGSFSIQYLMPSEQTAEEIRVRYFSETTWKQGEVIYTEASADPDKFAEVDLFGVTTAAQATREARYLAQTNRYRRRIVSFDVELEGMILSPLDLILISHDLPDWGQHAIAYAYDNTTRTMICDRDLTWGVGTHYARARARNGACSASIVVTQGVTAATLVFATSPGTIDLSGREPTAVAFGLGTAWQIAAKVLTIRPKDEYTATITALIENNLVHSGC